MEASPPDTIAYLAPVLAPGVDLAVRVSFALVLAVCLFGIWYQLRSRR